MTGEVYHKQEGPSIPVVLSYQEKRDNNTLRVTETDSEGVDCAAGYTNIEEVFKDIGGRGRFQWLLLTAVLLFHIPGCYAIWMATFVTQDVHWRCVPNSSSCTMNQTFPTTNDRFCSMNHTDWYFVEGTRTSLKSYFHLYCGREWLAYLATSSLFVGWAFSALFGSYLADRFGRKKSIFVLFTIFPLGSMVSVFSSTIEMFIVSRLVVGITIPSTFSFVYLLLGEFTNNENRALLMNILMSGYSISLIVLSLVAYFIRDWRILVLIAELPFALALLTYPFVPESMHWLMLKRKQEDLAFVIKKVCYWNNKAVPATAKTFKVAAEETSHRNRLTVLFKSPNLRVKSAVVLSGWCVIGLVYFGLGMAADNLTGAFHRDFAIMRGIEIFCSVTGIYLANRFGRKKTICVNMLFASVACILVSVVPSAGDIRILRLVLGLIGSYCINLVFILSVTWTLEMYGSDLRATIMGASKFMQQVGGASAPWIVKGLRYFDPKIPFLVKGGVGILCAFLMLLLLPETRGAPMQDVTRSADGCDNNGADNEDEPTDNEHSASTESEKV